jgi:serine/threonine protein kinase
MGEVYRARDIRLARDVAVKILPLTFTGDPDRLARFEREARVLASLNHPHIGAIYGLEESGGTRALVLELVEGDTLVERIARRLHQNEALAIARQMADALDAAHEKGIVHRDLKPANIKITPDRVVKVLDFGLAKMHETASVDQTSIPTVDLGATRHGLVIGTPAYMSPEQARGQDIDKRTDIWAFGCVLYEMLTGRAAFSGATTTDILAAVVDREPQWELLPAATPLNVTRALRRCLQKDPKKRARDIGDIVADLEEVQPAVRSHQSHLRRTRAIAVAVTALVGLGAAGASVVLLLHRSATESAERRVRFGITVEQQANDLISGTIPTPSPNGEMLAFVTSSQGQSVWVRPLDGIDARRLAGTEGAFGAVAWSPDGRWIGFFADGKLKKISPSGGPPQTIGTIPGFQDAAWGASGETHMIRIGPSLHR